MTDQLGFQHVYQPPTAERSGTTTLLLLHGTGGTEMDLLQLGRMLAPEAGVLSPRGKVLERGMSRFFRRLSEGVFDEDDLKARTDELADFIAAAAAHYQFEPRRVIAAGFSNGANIAGSLLLRRPDALGGAILFRAMVPLVPATLPQLRDKPVLISNGRQDPMVSIDETERLADLLRRSGAAVTVEWQAGGHELTPQDINGARRWLQPLL
jgi:predicted esterase